MYETHGRRPSGFTLIEILIVVIILGILAAIVIPSLSHASTDARLSSIASTVQTLRSEIVLYRVEHGDMLPNLVTDWTPMTQTSAYGTKNNLGPYMQAVPVNPLIQSAAASTKVVDGNGSATASGWTDCAFVYDYNGGAGSGVIWGVDNSGNIVPPY